MQIDLVKLLILADQQLLNKNLDKKFQLYILW